MYGFILICSFNYLLYRGCLIYLRLFHWGFYFCERGWIIVHLGTCLEHGFSSQDPSGILMPKALPCKQAHWQSLCTDVSVHVCTGCSQHNKVSRRVPWTKSSLDHNSLQDKRKAVAFSVGFLHPWPGEKENAFVSSSCWNQCKLQPIGKDVFVLGYNVVLCWEPWMFSHLTQASSTSFDRGVLVCFLLLW